MPTEHLDRGGYGITREAAPICCQCGRKLWTEATWKFGFQHHLPYSKRKGYVPAHRIIDGKPYCFMRTNCQRVAGKVAAAVKQQELF